MCKLVISAVKVKEMQTCHVTHLMLPGSRYPLLGLADVKKEVFSAVSAVYYIRLYISVRSCADMSEMDINLEKQCRYSIFQYD